MLPVVGLGLLKLIRMRLAKRERRGYQTKHCERDDFIQRHSHSAFMATSSMNQPACGPLSCTSSLEKLNSSFIFWPSA